MAIERSRLPQKWNLFQRFQLPKKKRKWLLVSVVVIVSLALGLASYLRPVEAEVLTVHPAQFSKGFTEEGKVIATKEWPVVNMVGGKLQTLYVQNGDKVKKGQLLLEMSTTELKYQLESLRGQFLSLEGQQRQSNKPPYEALVAQQKLVIEQAENDVKAQEQNLERTKQLFEAGAIPQVQYEEAQRNLDKAKNVLEQQKRGLELLYEQQQAPYGTEMYFQGQKNALAAQIQQLEEKLAQAKVYAPSDGTVKDLSLKEGMVIPEGQQVLTVFQAGGYKVESYVLAADALSVTAGSPVQIIVDTGEGRKTLKGKLETVEPSAVERVSPLGLKEYRVKVVISLPDDFPLLLGSSVDVKFTTYEAEGKLMVPKTAVFPYQGGQAVWIVKEGKAKIQPVKTGLENERQVIITEGLADGDVVLLDTELKGLKEGKRIKAAPKS